MKDTDDLKRLIKRLETLSYFLAGVCGIVFALLVFGINLRVYC